MHREKVKDLTIVVFFEQPSWDSAVYNIFTYHGPINHLSEC